jgi:hypothetical protein
MECIRTSRPLTPLEFSEYMINQSRDLTSVEVVSQILSYKPISKKDIKSMLRTVIITRAHLKKVMKDNGEEYRAMLEFVNEDSPYTQILKRLKPYRSQDLDRLKHNIRDMKYNPSQHLHIDKLIKQKSPMRR